MNTPIEESIAVPLGIERLLANNRRAMRRRRWAWSLVMLSLVGLGGWRLRAHLLEPPPPVRYDTELAHRGGLTVKVTATGTLQPVVQVDVGTEVSGTVESVEVYFNDRVEKGQVLARLDTTQLAARERQSQAALKLAVARVQDARATVLESRNRLTRAQRLTERKLTTAEDLDAAQATSSRAQAGLAVAEAQVNQAQAQLDYDRRLLEKAVIHAPISGIVLKRQVEPGTTVAATLQTPVLFTLAENLKQMLLNVQVDEADVGKVAAGQTAEFTVDAYPNRRFPATITLLRYVPQTVEGVVTYEAQLSVDNSELLLRPGMTATAEIAVQENEKALLVPNAALRFSPPQRMAAPTDSGGSLVARLMWRPPPPVKRVPEAVGSGARVWLLRDAQPVSIPVTVGATDGTNTEITAGEVEPEMPLIVGVQAPAL
jgi:HlyD family secretion protein